MFDYHKMLSLAAGTVVIYFLERAAEMTWPETSAETWWCLAAVGVVLWAALTYRSDLGHLFHQGRTKTGQVPLIEGIDLAWASLKDTPVLSDVEGKSVFQYLAHQMFNGTEKAVPVYGIRPPLRSRALIGNAHEYQLGEDGSATHLFDESDRVTDLHVRRADVKRWIRNTLADRRKAVPRSKSRQ